MNIDIDIDAFYREQDKRMNLPDEDFNEYLARIGIRTRSTFLSSVQPLIPTRSFRQDIDRSIMPSPGYASQDPKGSEHTLDARGSSPSTNVTGMLSR
jgi:hypothetical protein